MSEQTEPTPVQTPEPTPVQPTEDEDESEEDESEKDLREKYLRNMWKALVGEKQDKEEDEKQQILNSVFNKQAQIALNLNKVREDALNNLEENKSKKFKDDTEEYIKSIGMKVIRDDNPDFADTVEEARAIDKNFNPKRVDDLEYAKKRIIDKMREYARKKDNRGVNKMIEDISDALEKFDYIYNTDDLLELTPDEIDKLTQNPFPYSFESGNDLKKINIDELEKYLTYRVNVARRLSDKVKAHKTDLQQQMKEYKDNTSFTTNEKVALDNKDEFYATAKPTIDAYTELIKNYSQYLTPDVITELEKNVKQIKDYITAARLKGVDAGKMAEYTRLVNTVRKNVKENYQNILNKMQAYSNSVSAEDAILNEIKSLASYEQYSQLPPAIFEKLPEEIKNKVTRLMELKAKLQKQQGKTKKISNKYKEPPSSNDKPKILNPMLNKGYSIHNKVAQHNAYNTSFA